MGSRERRERDRNELRQRILDAAQRIITQEGFAALTMRKLAERIEYSPAAIYLHFRSREEIAQELAEAGFAKLLEGLLAARSQADTVKRLEAMGQAYVRFGLENAETYRLIFLGDAGYMSAAFGEQDPDGAAAKAWGLLVEAAGDLLKRNGAQGKTPEAVAQLLWATLHGIVSLHLACTGFRGSEPEALARLATEMAVKGLG
jgi:AcrR family transcriptional regulator